MLPPNPPTSLLDTRIRLHSLSPFEHDGHRLTLNIYLADTGATHGRVWCATCGRTLRVQGRDRREDDEVSIGIG